MLKILCNHPAGASHLIIVELLERFSYYSFQALIVLYLTSKLKIIDKQAYMIVGVFVSLTYAAPVIGGYIADRYLGLKLSIFCGMLFLALSYFSLICSNTLLFYCALAMQVLGSALYKGNITGLFASLYKSNDSLRENGFTLLYTGINIGSMLSAVISACIAHIYAWQYAFILSGTVIVIAMVIFFFRYRESLYEELYELMQNLSVMKVSLSSAGVVIFIIVTALLLLNLIITNIILLVTAVLLVGITIVKARYSDAPNQRRLYLLLFILFASMVFEAFYQQAFMSLTIFTERNVDRNVFGYLMPTAMFQAINPFFVVIISIIMMTASGYWSNKKLNAAVGMKLVYSMLIMAIGFWILVLGIMNADTQGYSSIGWLATSYLLQAFAELLFIPISYSLVASLSPVHLLGLMMGFWSFSQAIANILASYISNFTVISSSAVDPLVTNPLYYQVFFYIGLFGVLIAIVILYIVKKYLYENINIKTLEEKASSA